MEWRLFDPACRPDFFDADWYATRERAPHLEQWQHRQRLNVAADLVCEAVAAGGRSVVDLGCGDGGLLSLLAAARVQVPCWGFDLMAANVEAARRERRVDVRYCDFVNQPIYWADVAVITECLEHLEDPHKMVAAIFDNCRWVVASSPAFETAESHDAVHAWAWDCDGYRHMFEAAGFTVDAQHVTDGDYRFQIILGEHRR